MIAAMQEWGTVSPDHLIFQEKPEIQIVCDGVCTLAEPCVCETSVCNLWPRKIELSGKARSTKEEEARLQKMTSSPSSLLQPVR